jgi:hypothetical protein
LPHCMPMPLQTEAEMALPHTLTGAQRRHICSTGQLETLKRGKSGSIARSIPGQYYNICGTVHIPAVNCCNSIFRIVSPKEVVTVRRRQLIDFQCKYFFSTCDASRLPGQHDRKPLTLSGSSNGLPMFRSDGSGIYSSLNLLFHVALSQTIRRSLDVIFSQISMLGVCLNSKACYPGNLLQLNRTNQTSSLSLGGRSQSHQISALCPWLRRHSALGLILLCIFQTTPES